MESSSSVWPNIGSVEDFWRKITKNAELREKIQPYYEYMLTKKENCTTEKEIKHQIIKQTFLKVRIVTSRKRSCGGLPSHNTISIKFI